MTGIGSAAEISRGISEMQKTYNIFSQSIERNLHEFQHLADGHPAMAAANAYAVNARLEAERIAKKVKRLCKQGRLLVKTLRSGSEAEVKSIEVDGKSVNDLKLLLSEVTSANNRLELALDRAAESQAWAKNRATISYMRSSALDAFLSFESVIADLVFCAESFVEDADSEFSYIPETMSFSVRDNTIAQPSWIKSSDDFVTWIDNLTDEEINGSKH